MASVIEQDLQHLWHPFTPMSEWAATPPLAIDRADGPYLFDQQGKQYLDAISSLWVNVHGHGHPVIVDAIQRQAERLAHSTLLGLTNAPAAQLAARLAALSPGNLTRVFYSDSGSTAVEIALKQAYQYWQQSGKPEKTALAHLEHSYHGDTLGAVGVGGISLFHEIYGPLIRPGVQVPSPAADATPDRALSALERLLHEKADTLAAIIVEPLVQGAAGILVHPPGFLRGVADLCQRHDVLLIVDEVATGFGRTGRMFACEHEDVVPDFLCLAKGITGGTLPLAATVTSNRIYEAFLGAPAEKRTFFHGHTYTGNPIACAAALATLDVFDREQTLEKLPGLAETLAHKLSRLAQHPRVAQVRQRGLMAGVELESKDPAARLGQRVCMAARDQGVILRPLGDTIVVMPPFCVDENHLEQIASAIEEALVRVQ